MVLVSERPTGEVFVGPRSVRSLDVESVGRVRQAARDKMAKVGIPEALVNKIESVRGGSVLVSYLVEKLFDSGLANSVEKVKFKSDFALSEEGRIVLDTAGKYGLFDHQREGMFAYRSSALPRLLGNGYRLMSLKGLDIDWLTQVNALLTDIPRLAGDALINDAYRTLGELMTNLVGVQDFGLVKRGGDEILVVIGQDDFAKAQAFFTDTAPHQVAIVTDRGPDKQDMNNQELFFYEFGKQVKSIATVGGGSKLENRAFVLRSSSPKRMENAPGDIEKAWSPEKDMANYTDNLARLHSYHPELFDRRNLGVVLDHLDPEEAANIVGYLHDLLVHSFLPEHLATLGYGDIPVYADMADSLEHWEADGSQRYVMLIDTMGATTRMNNQTKDYGWGDEVIKITPEVALSIFKPLGIKVTDFTVVGSEVFASFKDTDLVRLEEARDLIEGGMTGRRELKKGGESRMFVTVCGVEIVSYDPTGETVNLRDQLFGGIRDEGSHKAYGVWGREVQRVGAFLADDADSVSLEDWGELYRGLFSTRLEIENRRGVPRFWKFLNSLVYEYGDKVRLEIMSEFRRLDESQGTDEQRRQVWQKVFGNIPWTMTDKPRVTYNPFSDN